MSVIVLNPKLRPVMGCSVRDRVDGQVLATITAPIRLIYAIFTPVPSQYQQTRSHELFNIDQELEYVLNQSLRTLRVETVSKDKKMEKRLL